ncbi:MAG: HAD family hydrolase [Bacteroidetes bacterium]|nr:HAD family hydrolase [Bacteroidota bacterium]
MKKILLFDWGNTIMVDFELPGPMYTWDIAEWVPGAEEALKALSRFTCCIATNGAESDKKDAVKGLAMVGADRYFSHIFASKDMGVEKPDPEFFAYILRSLDPDPSVYVMIGDNYGKDIIGAKQAGISTIFFNRSNRAGSFPMADAIIYSMEELPPVIEKL